MVDDPDDDGERGGAGAGKVFLQGLHDDMKGRLHIMVRTTPAVLQWKPRI